MTGDRAPLRARRGSALALLVLLCASFGCESFVPWVGIRLLYREAELPAEQALLDIPYRTGADADPAKHRLDLFVPARAAASDAGWPVLVFVHGGGWTSGDRAYTTGGADVYRNIGRFFASNGVGVAVISYRLQPAVDWRTQIDDVAGALDWVHANVSEYGGDPRSLFLGGHSAGAYLAGRVGLDGARLDGLGVDPSSICGLVLVSGAAFDLEDVETWRLGADPVYYEERLSDGDALSAWQHEASVVPLIDADDPPALVVYAEGEARALQRQSRVVHAAFRDAGAASRIVEVPGEDHYRIVLTLSRDDKTAGPAILSFLQDSECADVR